MKCNVCGAEVHDGIKFCANCGNPLENPTNIPAAEPAPAAIPDPVVPETATENPVSEPVVPTANPYNNSTPTETPAAEPVQAATPDFGSVPTENPYSNTQATSPDFNNPTPVGYGQPNMPPVGLQGQPQKKKSKVGLIIFLCMIPVILIIAVVVIIFAVGYSTGNQAAESAAEYWQAYAACDADAMADMVPDQYWDYISDTYDASKEEAVSCLQYYLDETAENLGGNLTCDWEQHGIQAGYGDSDVLTDVNDVLNGYGLSTSRGVGISLEATVSGDADSMEYDFAMWVVKIDGEWYNVSAMSDFDDVFSSGYLDAVRNTEKYGSIIDQYWYGFSKADGAALAELVPENFWDFLSDNVSISREEAEGYLNQYLSNNMSDSFSDLSKLTIDSEITDVDEYDDDAMADMNSGLEEYGLAGDAMVDVYTDMSLSYEGEVTEDSSYVTLTQIGGTWYVYDLMYYFVDACDTYASAE